MVASHVLPGVTVPLSVSEFLAGVSQRYPERDGMVFLPGQVTEYDRKTMTAGDVAQLEIFVRDEASAIQWLRAQLRPRPQSFQDLHPHFLRELRGQLKHEKLPELSEMLEQNFLHYDGSGEVPSQIHSYLSTNYKDLRKLPKDHPALQARANGRWYVPDPNKAADVEKRRTRTLLREFDEYRASSQPRLKLFRLEAVRTGFFRAYQDGDRSPLNTAGFMTGFGAVEAGRMFRLVAEELSVVETGVPCRLQLPCPSLALRGPTRPATTVAPAPPPPVSDFAVGATVVGGVWTDRSAPPSEGMSLAEHLC